MSFALHEITQYLQIPAIIAGVLSVFLAARESIWNWLFGIITITLYILILEQVAARRR